MKLPGFAWSITAFVCLVAATAALVPRQGELLEAQARDPDPKVAIPALEAQRSHADAAAPLRLATVYERAGKPREAIRVLAETGRARPLTADEARAVRRTALATGQPAFALRVLGGPHETIDPARRTELVDLALAGAQLDLALWHQKMLAKDVPDAATYTRLRDVAVMARQLPTALDAQRRLVLLQPTREAGDKLVALTLESGDARGALLALEAHVPRDGAAWDLRAMELAEWAGLHKAAATHGLAAYRAEPAHDLGKRVVEHFNAVRDPEALALVADLVRRWPGDRDFKALQRTLLAQAGRMEELEALLRADFAASPDDPAALEALTGHLLGKGDRAGAIAELTGVARRRPADREIRVKLAQVLTWDGKMEEARAIYAGLHRDAGTGGPVLADRPWREAWLNISRLVDDLTADGRANLHALVALDGQRLEWRRRLAAAEQEVGNLDAAIAQMRAVAADPRATGDDRLLLSDWLAWADRPQESFTVLAGELIRGPVAEPRLEAAVRRAAAGRRWAEAATLLQALTVQRPRDANAWEMLASVREFEGDHAAAAAAWHRRNALDGGDADRRIAEASLLLKAGRLAQALGVLQVRPAKASPAELRLRASLAGRLGLREEQARAYRGLITKRPDDAPAHLGLAAALDGLGRELEAEQAMEAALRLQPDDRDLLLALAGRRMAGPHPAAAAPYVTRLESLPAKDAEVLRTIADFYQPTEPRRAAAALDQYHAQAGGDAGTWFRRAELALDAGDDAVARAAFEAAARRAPSAADPELREAGAYAWERLGREAEAEAAWAAIARAWPTRPEAHRALARSYMARKDLAAADPEVAWLKAHDPDSTATRLLAGELLAAQGRKAEAAEVLAGVPARDPEAAYAAAGEAVLRHDLGEYGRAKAAARRALLSQRADALPGKRNADAGVQDTWRLTRDAASDTVGARAMVERYAGLDRAKFFATGLKRWGDRLSLEVEAGRATWAGGAVGAEELGATLAADGGAWRVALKAGGATPADPATSADPLLLGRLDAAFRAGAFELSATAGQARWEELDLAARRGGTERSVGAGVAWRPDPRLNVALSASAGVLSLGGAAAGDSRTYQADVSLAPAADSPLALRYQARHRVWGDAGPAVGLPAALPYHVGSIAWVGRVDRFRFEVAPGAQQDLGSGAIAPTAAGAVAYDLGDDAELTAGANWGGQSLAIGTAGTYTQFDAGARWHF